MDSSVDLVLELEAMNNELNLLQRKLIGSPKKERKAIKKQVVELDLRIEQKSNELLAAKKALEDARTQPTVAVDPAAAAQEELDNAMAAFKAATDEESSLAARQRIMQAKQAKKALEDVVIPAAEQVAAPETGTDEAWEAEGAVPEEEEETAEAAAQKALEEEVAVAAQKAAEEEANEPASGSQNLVLELEGMNDELNILQRKLLDSPKKERKALKKQVTELDMRIGQKNKQLQSQVAAKAHTTLLKHTSTEEPMTHSSEQPEDVASNSVDIAQRQCTEAQPETSSNVENLQSEENQTKVRITKAVGQKEIIPQAEIEVREEEMTEEEMMALLEAEMDAAAKMEQELKAAEQAAVKAAEQRAEAEAARQAWNAEAESKSALVQTLERLDKQPPLRYRPMLVCARSVATRIHGLRGRFSSVSCENRHFTPQGVGIVPVVHRASERIRGMLYQAEVF